MIHKLKKIIQNKIIIYLISRYGTFIAQFFTSIYLAIKLGPYEFGIWSFILLIINYLTYINLGIPNSLNVLLIQARQNKELSNDLILNSFALNIILAIIVISIEIYYFKFGISFFDKYDLKDYFVIIGLIGILFHFNSIFGTISRINNRLFELGVFQSIIPFLILFTILLVESKNLLQILLLVTLIGHIITLMIFFFSRQFSFNGKLNLKLCQQILRKGFYLFLYNISFLFIIISTRTMISFYYEVDEFGIFNFFYTVANSILLLLQAFTVVIFPKIIDQLNSSDNTKVLNTKWSINNNYVTLAYILIFCGISILPFIIQYITDYKNSSFAICLIAMVLLSSTNVFANTSLLMAKNMEKKLALISIISLVNNLVICYVLINVFQLHFHYIILSTLSSYLLFGIFTSKCVLDITNEKRTNFSEIILDFFPYRLLLPFLFSLILILNGLENYLFIPFGLFLYLNNSEIFTLYDTINKILLQPKSIDLE